MIRVKKALALCLVIVMTSTLFFSCSSGSGIDQIAWEEYDALISEARTETDPLRRETLLHLAEDMLMSTECVTPIYDRHDAYLMKSALTGVYGTSMGAKYFMYAQNGEKKDITLNFADIPQTLDPAFAESVSELTIAVNTFSGLFRFDPEGNVVPDLAEAYAVSEDGLTYTFTLKSGLVWSDGAQIGASDFVYSWRRVADENTKSPYSHLCDVIARNEEDKLDITADETNTILTVKLASPCDYFVELCAFPAFYPVKEAAVEYADGYMDSYGNILDADAWTKNPHYPTCGAFVAVTISTSEQYVFAKNSRYWNNNSVTISNVYVRLSADAGAAYASYEAGELDFIDTVPASVKNSLAVPSEYHVDDLDSVYYLCYNYNSSIYNGMSSDAAAKLRRAISLYIDREAIVSGITANGEAPATSLIPMGVSDGLDGLFRRNDTYHRYKNMNCVGYYDTSVYENRNEALQILIDLGLDTDEDGVIDPDYRFSMHYLTLKTTKEILIAQSIQQDLAEIGITVMIEAVDEKVFDYEQMITPYDIIIGHSSVYYDDPLSVLEHWTTDAKLNYAGLGAVIVEEDENAY